MDLDTELLGAASVAPGDRIVAGKRARRVIEGAKDRLADLLGQVEQRHQAGELLTPDELGIDAEMLVHLGPPA